MRCAWVSEAGGPGAGGHVMYRNLDCGVEDLVTRVEARRLAEDD